MLAMLLILGAATSSTGFISPMSQSGTAGATRTSRTTSTSSNIPPQLLTPMLENTRTYAGIGTGNGIGTSLNAFPLAGLGIDELVYQAQSTASQLASASISSSALSSTSISSLTVLYFAGLLTSFSPCSLGLLPLTISYISNAAGEREDKAVFLPTLFFAFGLASVFCGLGLSVAMIGGVFGSSSSVAGGSGVLGTIILAFLSSGVSIAMGLQLLELVNLPLPSLEIGSFSSNAGNGPDADCSDGVCRQITYSDDGRIVPSQDDSSVTAGTAGTAAMMNGSNGGAASSLFRTFLLGGSSALVASPCATPVLTSILGFVAASRDPALGAILLFTYTVGYSTPLLIVGASGGQALANAQVAASSDGDESLFAKIGSVVNPLTATILIWYGTNGFLEALFGDPSMFALNPVLDYTL
jgi:cytochrome c-type biogenesis protein